MVSKGVVTRSICCSCADRFDCDRYKLGCERTENITHELCDSNDFEPSYDGMEAIFEPDTEDKVTIVGLALVAVGIGFEVARYFLVR